MRSSEKGIGQKLLVLGFDNISGDQFASSPCFDFAVDFDFTVLNQPLRAAARVGDSAEFQELVETQSFKLRIRCIVSH